MGDAFEEGVFLIELEAGVREFDVGGGGRVAAAVSFDQRLSQYRRFVQILQLILCVVYSYSFEGQNYKELVETWHNNPE